VKGYVSHVSNHRRLKTKNPPPSGGRLQGAPASQEAPKGAGGLPNRGEFVPLAKVVEDGANLRSGTVECANNLTAAMSAQTEQLQEVEQFLSEIGLERYFRIFEENGFDCMEAVLELTEERLANLGVAMGHRLKLLKRVQEKMRRHSNH